MGPVQYAAFGLLCAALLVLHWRWPLMGLGFLLCLLWASCWGAFALLMWICRVLAWACRNLERACFWILAATEQRL